MDRRTFIAAGGGLALAGLTGGCAAFGRPGLTAAEPLARIAPQAAGIDPETLGRLHAFIEGELQQGLFPGAALLCSRHGKIFDEQYWGTYCSTETRAVPLTADVRQMGFSFSKLISATVAAIAQEKGLFQYDQRIAEFIPEFGVKGKEAITIRQCLTHSAGIPTAPGAAPVFTPEQWDTAIAAMCDAPLEWPPASRTYYHGMSAMLLVGEVVRRTAGGEPWSALCQRWLFDPLGAATMTFGVPEGVPVALTPQPTELPKPLTAENFPFLGHPAGGIITTPADILRMLHLHLNEGDWRGNRILKPETMREMHRVQYAEAIAQAKAAGKPPTHEYWGLGVLTRGEATGGWFGLGSEASPRAYGHAGIGTVIGNADPERDLAWVFTTTDQPKDNEQTTRVRNTVSDWVVKSVQA